MLIPVRCFTCNSIIGHQWEPFKEMVAEYIASGKTEMEAKDLSLNNVGFSFERYCCRRMFLGHVDVIDDLLLYSDNDPKLNQEMQCRE